MSTFLYTLGHRIARFKWQVLVAWILLVIAAFGVAGVTGGTLVNDYSIPGTESQRGIDTLALRFPQASGTTGQVVFTSTSGPIASHNAGVEALITAIGKVPHVTSVDDPFASGAVGTISSDQLNAQSSIQFDVAVTDLPDNTVSLVEAAAKPPVDAGFTTTLGGAMYPPASVAISITELLGVFLAFVVLAVTFSSLLAAGMPLVTAAIGVGITLSGVITVASFATISTTTPTLALMIGLAVGIDYGLFIVTRHRRQLATGMDVGESIAQASATAGSAVVFAGMTVIIALCGLAVANIPFLAVMGFAAAVGVGIAVLAALTLLPSFLAIIGERLRPKARSRNVRLARKADEGRTFGARWVAIVTKVPIVTVLLVLVGIGVMAIPAKDLALSLPDNGSAEAGSPPRVTYDLVAKEFGPGFNGPLLVTANIITSTDPKGVVNQLATDIAAIPGVLSVTKQTPNQTADLGLVKVVPQWGPSDPRTSDLVQRLRAQESTWQQQLGVTDLLVTGQTAVGIDVSAKLTAALVPFGIVVVGLSLVLLAIVFRSVAVPIKATLGYLLSIAAALGAVTATCSWGWLAGPLSISYVGPLVSFMPIILMGVLFGLAMDYEVFLVSQMREDYVHAGDARHAIRTGFVASARVVTAAAIIMIAVFAAFIPDGSVTIKPIAIGLTTGVFVDAFLVRMTLVPAVLALLGSKAWWMPRWLDRALPELDVEGQSLVKHVEQAEWDEANPGIAVRAEGLVLESSNGLVEVDLRVPEGVVWTEEHDDPRLRSALVWTLAGWRKPHGGRLAVLGYALPEESGFLRRTARVVPASTPDEDGLTVHEYVSTTLRAQSAHPWSRGNALSRVLDQADAWLEPITAPRADDAEPLEKRRLGALSAIERQLVALSVARAQDPRLIAVQDADAGLDPMEMSWFAGVCDELVSDGGVTVLLVGERVNIRGDHAAAAAPKGRELVAAATESGTETSASSSVSTKTSAPSSTSAPAPVTTMRSDGDGPAGEPPPETVAVKEDGDD